MRPHRTHPTTMMAASLLAAALLGSPARAEGIVDVGAEGSTAFPVGNSIAQAGDAALGLQLAVSRSVWGPLTAGIIAGRQGQEFHASDVPDAKLTTTFVGGRLQYLFGSEEWEAQPFVAVDLAWASHRIRGDEASFAPPRDHTTTSGLLFAPEAGLWALIPRVGGALRFALRTQRVGTADVMALGIRRATAIWGLGVSLGAYYKF